MFQSHLPKIALLAALSLLSGVASATCTKACTYRIYIPGLQGPATQTLLSANPSALAFGSVTAGSSAQQSFTLTNNGVGAATSLAWTLPAGVTESDNCGTTLGAGASCSVVATYAPTSAGTLSGAITVSAQDSHAQVSVSGTATATVSRIYVANGSSANPLYLCNLNADGSIGTCTSESGGSSPTYGVTVSGQYVYLSTNTSTNVVCQIGSGDTTSGCVTTGSGFSTGAQLALNNGLVYVANFGSNTVSVCTIGTGGALTGCQTTGSGFNEPIGMAFTGSTVFVANYGSSAITACTVAANGTFSGCAQAGTTAASANGGIVLNGNYAYIDNNNGTIYQCTASGQTISGCTAISTGTTGLRSMYLSNNVLYAPSFQGTLLAFAVGSGGSLTKLNSVSLTAPEAVWPAP